MFKKEIEEMFDYSCSEIVEKIVPIVLTILLIFGNVYIWSFV